MWSAVFNLGINIYSLSRNLLSCLVTALAEKQIYFHALNKLIILISCLRFVVLSYMYKCTSQTTTSESNLITYMIYNKHVRKPWSENPRRKGLRVDENIFINPVVMFYEAIFLEQREKLGWICLHVTYEPREPRACWYNLAQAFVSHVCTGQVSFSWDHSKCRVCVVCTVSCVHKTDWLIIWAHLGCALLSKLIPYHTESSFKRLLGEGALVRMYSSVALWRTSASHDQQKAFITNPVRGYWI